MKKYSFKREFLRILYSLLFISWSLSAVVCQAKPIQLFLMPVSQGACKQPLEIIVYVLNDKGEVDLNFDGAKKIKVSVKEKDGIKENSFHVSLDKTIKFKRGKSSFSIEDSEPETLDMTVEVENVKITASVKLLFEDKDAAGPVVESIAVEKADIVALKFNEEIKEESAQKTENYTAVTNKRQVHPKKVEYHKDYVILEFPQGFDKDEEGYIEVEGIEDLNGNEIPSDTRSPDFKGDCGC